MSVIGSCGHKFTEYEGLGTSIWIKGYSKDGSKACDYVTPCTICIGDYRKRGMELKTKKERDNWLK